MAEEVDDQQHYCGRRTLSDGAATYGGNGSRRMSTMEISELLDINVRWMKLEWLDRLETEVDRGVGSRRCKVRRDLRSQRGK